jgi:hypothetical protein
VYRAGLTVGLLAAGTLLLPVEAGAGDGPGLELTPFAGLRLGGSFDGEDSGGADRDLELDDGGSFGLLVNLPATEPGTWWEILVSHRTTDVKVGGLLEPGETVFRDLDVTYFQAGGAVLLADHPVQPYLAAGLGLSRFDPDDPAFDAEHFFAFSLATGLRLAPARRLGLRLEARVFGNLISSDSDIFCETGGGEDGSGCLVLVDADLVWQWELLAGVTFRF